MSTQIHAADVVVTVVADSAPAKAELVDFRTWLNDDYRKSIEKPIAIEIKANLLPKSQALLDSVTKMVDELRKPVVVNIDVKAVGASAATLKSLNKELTGLQAFHGKKIETAFELTGTGMDPAKLRGAAKNLKELDAFATSMGRRKIKITADFAITGADELKKLKGAAGTLLDLAAYKQLQPRKLKIAADFAITGLDGDVAKNLSAVSSSLAKLTKLTGKPIAIDITADQALIAGITTSITDLNTQLLIAVKQIKYLRTVGAAGAANAVTGRASGGGGGGGGHNTQGTRLSLPLLPGGSPIDANTHLGTGSGFVGAGTNTGLAITGTGGFSVMEAAKLQNDIVTQLMNNAGMNQADAANATQYITGTMLPEGLTNLDSITQAYMHGASRKFRGDKLNALVEFGSESAASTGGDAAKVTDAMATFIVENRKRLTGMGFTDSIQDMERLGSLLHTGAQLSDISLPTYMANVSKAMPLMASGGGDFNSVLAYISMLSGRGFTGNTSGTWTKDILSHILNPTKQSQTFSASFAAHGGADLNSLFGGNALGGTDPLGKFLTIVKQATTGATAIKLGNDLALSEQLGPQGQGLYDTVGGTAAKPGHYVKGVLTGATKGSPGKLELVLSAQDIKALQSGNASASIVLKLINALRGGIAATVGAGTGTTDYFQDYTALNNQMKGKPTVLLTPQGKVIIYPDNLRTSFFNTQQSTQGQYNMLKGQSMATTIAIGDDLTPIFIKLSKTLLPAIAGLGKWAKANPGTVQIISEIGLALLALKPVLSILGAMKTIVTAPFKLGGLLKSSIMNVQAGIVNVNSGKPAGPSAGNKFGGVLAKIAPYTGLILKSTALIAAVATAAQLQTGKTNTLQDAGYVKDNLTNPGQLWRNLVTNFQHPSTSNLADAAGHSTILSFFSGLPEKISHALFTYHKGTYTPEGQASPLTGAGASIQDAFAFISSKAAGLKSPAYSGFLPTQSNGHRAGADLAAGLKAGAAMKATAQDMGTEFITGLRGIWETHSPSRVMIRIGQDLRAGLLIGFGSGGMGSSTSMNQALMAHSGALGKLSSVTGAFQTQFESNALSSSVISTKMGFDAWYGSLSELKILVQQYISVIIPDFIKHLVLLQNALRLKPELTGVKKAAKDLKDLETQVKSLPDHTQTITVVTKYVTDGKPGLPPDITTPQGLPTLTIAWDFSNLDKAYLDLQARVAKLGAIVTKGIGTLKALYDWATLDRANQDLVRWIGIMNNNIDSLHHLHVLVDDIDFNPVIWALKLDTRIAILQTLLKGLHIDLGINLPDAQRWITGVLTPWETQVQKSAKPLQLPVDMIAGKKITVTLKDAILQVDLKLPDKAATTLSLWISALKIPHLPLPVELVFPKNALAAIAGWIKSLGKIPGITIPEGIGKPGGITLPGGGTVTIGTKLDDHGGLDAWIDTWLRVQMVKGKITGIKIPVLLDDHGGFVAWVNAWIKLQLARGKINCVTVPICLTITGIDFTGLATSLWTGLKAALGKVVNFAQWLNGLLGNLLDKVTYQQLATAAALIAGALFPVGDIAEALGFALDGLGGLAAKFLPKIGDALPKALANAVFVGKWLGEALTTGIKGIFIGLKDNGLGAATTGLGEIIVDAIWDTARMAKSLGATLLRLVTDTSWIKAAGDLASKFADIIGSALSQAFDAAIAALKHKLEGIPGIGGIIGKLSDSVPTGGSGEKDSGNLSGYLGGAGYVPFSQDYSFNTQAAIGSNTVGSGAMTIQLMLDSQVLATATFNAEKDQQYHRQNLVQG